MKITYGSTLSNTDTKVISNIANECGILFDTARLLFYRNIDTVEKAKRFLNPSKSNFNDPFLFRDMQKAVDRIALAKALNQNVLVFGDYDADGICATTILHKCLKDYGIQSFITVPEREDGYGLNLESIKALMGDNKLDLLITVDCGISDKQAVYNLKQNGIDVIVTDHHEPPEELPECIIINPKVTGEKYPFNGLCGAGVAYKLGRALIGEKADKYLDFVAVATTADSMQLTDENRDLVVEGMKLLEPNQIRLPFKQLIGDNNKQVNTYTLVYQLAPRINAGGRMGDANSALKLFTTSNQQEIYDLAVKLNTYNMMRQTESERVFKEAKEIILSNGDIDNSIICVKGSGWSAGVIGIVSAKLVEHFGRPVIVFAEQDGKYKGSARSIDGVNIHKLISSQSQLLLTFGGHSQAAGLSIEQDKFVEFYNGLQQKMQELYGTISFEKTFYSDWDIEKPLSIQFAKQINALEPFGIGNKKPVFSTTVGQTYCQPTTNGIHYNFDTPCLPMINFNGEKDLQILSLPINKKVLFEVNYSIFRGKESVKGFVKNIDFASQDYSSLELYLFRNELLKIREKAQENLSPIPYSEDLIKKGFGTIYALSDYSNLSNYDTKDLPIYPFKPSLNSGENCIVISLSNVTEEYDNVVYLDNPLATVDFGVRTKTVLDLSGYDFVEMLDCDRTFFEQVFAYLSARCGKPFTNSVEECEQEDFDFENYSFIFATEVFFELGFFTVEKGYLKRNYGVKNALTNSLLYSKILNINGI